VAAERTDRLWTFAAAVLAVLVLAETAYIALAIVPLNWELGQDYVYYRAVGERFLADGSYYLPRQLEGPYVIRLMDDIQYPPSALFLFVPFAILPWVLWWAVAIAVTIYVLTWLRPRPWAWCVMLVLLAWPRAIGAYLFGNTDIWALAAICAGFRWGWPAILLVLKPPFAPFALIGIRRRSFWIAALLVGLASIPMVPLWLDYLVAARNAQFDPGYSLGSLPLLLVGVVAWLGSARRPPGSPSVPLPGRTTPRRLPPP
jgi:hypothetical protein